MPAPVDPLNMRAKFHRAGYSDQVGSPAQFKGEKHRHLARKIRLIGDINLGLRKRHGGLVKQNGKPDPALQARIRRQQADINYRSQREDKIRRSIGNYLQYTQALAMLICQAETCLREVESYPRGQAGGPECHHQGHVPKQPAQDVGRRREHREVQGGSEPNYHEIHPRYTSTFCFECVVEGENGTVDRRVSKDHGRCHIG